MKKRLLYYNTMIRSVLHYVSSIWTSCDKENLGHVFKLPKKSSEWNSDILPIDSSPEVCVGRTASLETKILGDTSDITIQWEKNFEPLLENEHYHISADDTTLYVFNALPIHSGEYRVSILKKHASWPLATAFFHLKVIDVHLDVLVVSPVVIVRGGIAILKIKKSQEGDLLWRHNGEIVRGSEPHYNFVNPSKTELKIYNAGPEQAGIYEVFIRKRQCEIRKEIEVRILG
ncbi:unnamed protein product, partial [Pocillopora meandrina]